MDQAELEAPSRYVATDEPRAVCPHCGRDYVPSPEGRVRKHRDFNKPFARGRNRRCPGSGEMATQMWVYIGGEWRLMSHG